MTENQNPPPIDDHLLDALARGETPLADIAAEADLSVLELSRLVCDPADPRPLEDLRKVARLHALRREMLSAHLKLNALLSLAQLRLLRIVLPN